MSFSNRLHCIPYRVADKRSFLEREPPLVDPPRKAVYSPKEDFFHYLHSLRLTVLATARDVESDINRFRKRIEPIVDLFHPLSRILICESDSTDKTVEKLRQWSRVQLYTYGNMSKLYPERSERIAFCRNKLLDLAHENKSDYIFVVDLDIFAATIPAFLTNFRYNTDDWSVMTASSKFLYYDIWALRTLSDSNLNYDVWYRVRDVFSSNASICHQSVVDQIIGIHQKIIRRDHGLIEVRSAFNGAGLYKTNVTYGCRYSGANLTCEHVPFHLCIREKKQSRIFINPAFTFN